MSEQVELLSRPVNYAVVQLPERNFPGVVVQGDTLNALVRRLERMSQLLAASELDELAAEIEDMREQLSGAVTHYESVCAARGIALPY
jgi:hypothetical protein